MILWWPVSGASFHSGHVGEFFSGNLCMSDEVLPWRWSNGGQDSSNPSFSFIFRWPSPISDTFFLRSITGSGKFTYLWKLAIYRHSHVFLLAHITAWGKVSNVIISIHPIIFPPFILFVIHSLDVEIFRCSPCFRMFGVIGPLWIPVLKEYHLMELLGYE